MNGRMVKKYLNSDYKATNLTPFLCKMLTPHRKFLKMANFFSKNPIYRRAILICCNFFRFFVVYGLSIRKFAVIFESRKMKTQDITNYINKEESHGMALLEAVVGRILGGGAAASLDEAVALAGSVATEDLTSAADRVRAARCGGRLDTCSIINARSGRCSEDCKWCSQSRHFATGVKEYDIVDEEEAVNQARDCGARGVMRYSLVTSGRRVTAAQIESFCRIFRRISAEVPGLKLCASMGLVGEDELKALAAAGVSRYHCNLETSSDYFPDPCSSHTHADK